MAGRPKIKPLTDAEKALVEANIYLADWGAGQLRHRYHSLTFDELRSVCSEALLYAAKSYEPAKSAFSTHAFHQMRSRVQRESQRARTIAVPHAHFTKCGEKNPGAHADAVKALAMRRVPSGQEHRDGRSAGADGASGIHASPDRGPGPDVETADREDAELLSGELAGQLAMLEPREADIIRRCVMHRSHTLEVVGQEYGICRERTRQIKEEAIATLRRRLKKGCDS